MWIIQKPKNQFSSSTALIIIRIDSWFILYTRYISHPTLLNHSISVYTNSTVCERTNFGRRKHSLKCSSSQVSCCCLSEMLHQFYAAFAQNTRTRIIALQRRLRLHAVIDLRRTWQKASSHESNQNASQRTAITNMRRRRHTHWESSIKFAPRRIGCVSMWGHDEWAAYGYLVCIPGIFVGLIEEALIV